MKKALSVLFAALIMLLVFTSCDSKPEVFTDPITGAQNLNKTQFETIQALGKSVSGKKLVVTLSADSFDNHIEYYAVDFSGNGTYTRVTYQFFYKETDFVDAQTLIGGNDYYEITEADRESFILIFQSSVSSGLQNQEGKYGEIKSGYENDPLKDYIIVE